jgi:energy-converting hydrogenase A subunit M
MLQLLWCSQLEALEGHFEQAKSVIKFYGNEEHQQYQEAMGKKRYMICKHELHAHADAAEPETEFCLDN